MFLKFTKEIYDIAKARGVDVGVAFAMLNADVKAGRAQEDNTLGILRDFDYRAARESLESLNDDLQTAAYAEIKRLFADPDNLRSLNEAYPSRNAMDMVVADWIVREHQKDEEREKDGK